MRQHTASGGVLSGFDLVEVGRLRAAMSRRPRLELRLFTSAEREYCRGKADPIPAYAARFAAKEAVGKLLGTGVITWQDIEVEPGPPPWVRLRGATALQAGLLGVEDISLSLTHTDGTAGATAVAFTSGTTAEAFTTWGTGSEALLPEPAAGGGGRADPLRLHSVEERPGGLSPAQVRRLDRTTIEELGVPSPVLMERAALGVTTLVLERYAGRHTLIVCGRGNNGGDGLAAARQLHVAGHPVACVVAASGAADLSPDGALNLRAAQGVGVNVRLGDAPGYLWDESEVVVDCLLGTGATGELREPVAAWAVRVNAAAARGVPVVAVDVPTGVDAGTGAIAAGTVTAGCTVTFHAPKTGLLVPPGSEAAGEVLVWDIGIPGFLEPDPEVRVVTEADVVVPGRRVDDHKYRAGFVGIVAGSAAYPGAAALTARAAARSGAGYVRLVTPAGAAERLRAMVTEAVLEVAGAEDLLGGPALAAVSDERFGALVVGPGLGRTPAALAAVREVIEGTAVPAVLDADGLMAYAGEPGALAGRRGLVLTPHVGELGSLLGESVGSVGREPLAAARRAAAATGQVMALKGSNSIIVTPEGQTRVVAQGPPQLATAGTGDVLSGCIGALLAKGLEPGEAAAAGVWLHAEAGRWGARVHPQGLLAEDVIELLPRVIAARLEERRPGWSN